MRVRSMADARTRFRQAEYMARNDQACRREIALAYRTVPSKGSDGMDTRSVCSQGSQLNVRSSGKLPGAGNDFTKYITLPHAMQRGCSQSISMRKV